MQKSKAVKKHNFCTSNWFLSLLACIALVFFLTKKLFYNESFCIADFPNPISFLLHKNLRIALVNKFGLGEKYACERMCNTLKKMGYCPIYLELWSDIKYPSLLDLIHVDFAIYAKPEIVPAKNTFSFIICHFPGSKIDERQYNAILSVIPQNIVRNQIKNLPVIPFYFSSPKTNFVDTPKNKLFFSGAFWDKFRAVQLKKLYDSFEKVKYFECYGNDESCSMKKYKFFKGYLESYSDYLSRMTQDGVSLVLHSNEHFSENISTSRIFESVAASNIIISDRLPFVVENFGDSVLYVDRNLPPELLFQQIDAHMKWILSHPKEAVELARRSHKIFVEKFSLEKQMQNVIDFYKKCTGTSHK